VSFMSATISDFSIAESIFLIKRGVLHDL
jgi:hypothetical protein